MAKVSAARTRIRWVAVAMVSAAPWVTLPAAEAGGRADRDDRVVLHDVALRPGVTADISFQVFVNERHPCEGRDVLAVPGFAHTAATFKPLADAFFAEAAGQKECRIVAVDLPAHGASSPPAGLVFGELTLDDSVRALQASLDRLPAHGIRARTLLGHSQGALLVEMLQQALTLAGTSLRDRFGIKDAVLLAPVAPAALPWAFVDNGTAGALLSNFGAGDAVLGPHIAIPDAAFAQVFFSDLTFSVVSGAPDAATVAARGYNAPEPLYGTLQLVGLPPFARPEVAPLVFGPDSGTTLRVVSFAQDFIIAAGEAAALYAYLTGDATQAGLVEVGGPAAVHDTYVLDPAAVVEAIAR